MTDTKQTEHVHGDNCDHDNKEPAPTTETLA